VEVEEPVEGETRPKHPVDLAWRPEYQVALADLELGRRCLPDL
jgi:hypothetical protein